MPAAKVLILGYGEMGHAMQRLLAERHSVTIWNHRPHPDLPEVDLASAAAESDVVIFCLPIIPHEKIVACLRQQLGPDTLVVSIAKGIDEKGRCAAQIFADGLAPSQPHALIYGPMISEEIQAGRAGFAQVAGTEGGYERVAALYRDSHLYLAPAADVLGISWAVILKNVYAILFGVADELQLGDNLRGFLAAESLRELGEIVVLMGGESGSVYHFAGLGDLITTATSEDSHHHSLGRQLGRGDRSAVRGEGVHTLEMIVNNQLFDTSHYPLFQLARDLVEGHCDPRQGFATFLQHRFA